MAKWIYKKQMCFKVKLTIAKYSLEIVHGHEKRFNIKGHIVFITKSIQCIPTQIFLKKEIIWHFAIVLISYSLKDLNFFQVHF